MSAHYGYVTQLKNVKKHPNADKLLIGECFGNNVCVNLDYYEGQVGIYFPCDLQLSVEFATQNNLLRLKDENGNNIGGYMDPDKRNVKAIKLRGEKSDGLFLPLNSLESFGDISNLKVGERVDVFNGHLICQKYIPRTNAKTRVKDGNRTRKKKVVVAPLFKEHADTEQLQYNLNAFHPNDLIEITLKMHGTSARTAYLPVFKGYKKTLKDFIFRKEGTPIYDWGYVSGTRRTVLENFEGGFYGSNAFREPHSKFFENKLFKGEEVYYEIVGFTDTGVPIMPVGNNKKVNDKEFLKQYGDTTTFSYGCAADLDSALPQSDIYVYRMTMTNEDGDIVEYTPDFMRYRCEQMGVKTVPLFYSGFVPEEENIEEWIMEKVEEYYDGPDPIGKTHIREGVVVRILNRPKFSAYKCKNFNFKVIEGIIKESALTPDIEEAQEVESE